VRALACVAAVVALALAGPAGATAPAKCPPLEGSISYVLGAAHHVVSLATCSDRVVARVAPTRSLPGVRTAPARTRHQWIRFDGRTIWAARANGPVVPISLSPDGHWLVFAIDPDASGSIAADGLRLRIVSTAGGSRAHVLGLGLPYHDYVAWCGRGLVFVEGGIRIAAYSKRLLAAAPPDWSARDLWPGGDRAFASPACAPSGDRVAVLTQRSSNDARFFSTRWQLWTVTLAGARRLVDAPPRGFADESPAWSPGGDAIAFVRERAGHGTLVVSQRGVHPIAPLGYSLGYYGHHDWQVAWHR
jgi:dipeptidyl aminopeptidase/acylaminoacyl peptidase